MKQTEQRNWTKLVMESNGKRVFLPEKFLKDAEKWNKKRENFEEETVKMAEKEIHMHHQLNSLFVGIREYLAENGYHNIWLKDLGFDSEALKDGQFVVNIDLKN